MKSIFLAILLLNISYAIKGPKNKTLDCSALLKNSITIGMEEETSRSHDAFRSFLRELLTEHDIGISQIDPNIAPATASSDKFSQKNYSKLISRIFGIEKAVFKPDEVLENGKNYGFVLHGEERIKKYFKNFTKIRTELSETAKFQLMNGNVRNAVYGVIPLFQLYDLLIPFILPGEEVNNSWFMNYFSAAATYTFAYTMLNYLDFAPNSAMNKILGIIDKSGPTDWFYTSKDYKLIDKNIVENIQDQNFAIKAANATATDNITHTPYFRGVIPGSPKKFYKPKTHVYVDYLLENKEGEYQLNIFIRTTDKKPKFKKPAKDSVKETILELLRNKVLAPVPVYNK